MASEALIGARAEPPLGRDPAERNARLGLAFGASALFHALAFAAFGAAPGAQFARPWMSGSGASLTVVSLNHAPEASSSEALAGAIASADPGSFSVAAGELRPGTSADSGPAADASGRNGPAQTAPVSLLPQPQYYPSNELDTRPGIMVHIKPDYPEQAIASQISGKAVIRLYINERGSIDDAVAISGTPPGVFEESALRAFREARFSPGAKGGIPVKCYITLEVNFELPMLELKRR